MTPTQIKVFSIIHGIGFYILATYFLQPQALLDYLLIAALCAVAGVVWTRGYAAFWEPIIRRLLK